MNLVFMGTPQFSVPTLEMLHASGHSIQAVLTQPDRPRGRGKKLLPSPVKAKAEQLGLRIFQPQSLRKGDDAQEMLQRLLEFSPDLIVVIAYGQILPKEILTLPKYGCINLHASLLPRWRGAAPIQRAILAGDTESGVTAMQMAEGLDTGDILLAKRIALAPDETASSLHDRLSVLAAEVLQETLEQCIRGTLQPVPQDDAYSCNAAKITKAMSRTDFTESAEQIDRLIRAVTVSAELNGKRIKLLCSRKSAEHSTLPPGTIVEKQTLTFVCGDGCCVSPTIVQAEGARAMPTEAFLRGFPLQNGDRLMKAE